MSMPSEMLIDEQEVLKQKLELAPIV
jgi:hypothetical protein